MATASGSRLGRYEILNPVGAGGMGEVYRARDSRLDRDVAVKILPVSVANDPERLARFDREAKAVAALSHPNILALHDAGSEGGVTFAVMELLEGETLRDRLASGALPPRRAIDVAVQIARGLAAAHAKGLVHRDLKPENVFLVADGQVKILDFGLAKPADHPADAAATATQLAGVTDPGTVLGTVGYMAPEQVRGHAIDGRTDLFALGAVMYEMLAGRRAFQADTAAETMTAILKEDPPEWAARAELTPALASIVRHALEKQPAERFQSARDIAFALQSLSGSGTAAMPATPAKVDASRRGLRALVTVAAALLLVAAGALGAKLLSSPPSAPKTFTTKTFDDTIIRSARFMPDGRTIVYSAGRTRETLSQMFALRDGSTAPQGFGPAGILLAVSRGGELAVLTDVTVLSGIAAVGTLSRMTLDSAPRPVLTGVKAADWSPDGNAFAIVRRVDGLDTLEYPIGTALYKSPGYLSDVRISPDGGRVLFMDHHTEGDDRGWVRIVDRDGTQTLVGGEFTSAQGTAWSHDGREVFFSGAIGNQNLVVWSAVAPPAGGGEPSRTQLLSVPGEMAVVDAAADGSLLTLGSSRNYRVGVKVRHETGERYLTYQDTSWGPSLAADGSLLLFTDGRGGPDNAGMLRRTDGSPAARLGDGAAVALSPDGRWALVVELRSSPQKLVAYPTGPGDQRVLSRGPIDKYTADVGYWSPDSKTFVFRAAEANKGPRTFIQTMDGSAPRVVVPEGVRVALFSADSRSLVGITPEGGWQVHPIDGGAPSDLAVVAATDEPVGWSTDGRAVIVATRTIPTRLERVELSTGARRVLRELRPPGLEGVRVSVWSVTADGEQFAYNGIRQSRTLYVVK
jgi:aminoglycoside phosphotransferase (APT) family kinase protein/Tol biopolymer transport system component